jgi:hypothetical protein
VATLIVTGARAPVALEWLRILSRQNHQVTVADTHKGLAGYSKLSKNTLIVASPRFDFDRFKEQVLDYLKAVPVDRIVPTCEEIFYWALALRGSPFQKLLWAPDFDLLLKLHSKKDFLKLVRQAGLETPLSTTFDDLDSLLTSVSDEQLKQLVVKAEYSRFAASAAIRPNSKNDLRKRFENLARQPWISQQALTGQELCTYSIFDQGKVWAHVTYPSQITFGAGSNVFFETIDHPLIGPWLNQFARSLPDLSAQLAFDFFLEGNRLLPIECNPRSTSGLHLLAGSAAFCSQVGALILGQSGQPIVPAPLPPKALTWPLLLLGPQSLVQGRLALWLRALSTAKDVIFDRRDLGVLFGQCVQSLQLIGSSLVNRRSIAACSTHDIEFGFDQKQSLQ